MCHGHSPAVGRNPDTGEVKPAKIQVTQVTDDTGDTGDRGDR